MVFLANRSQYSNTPKNQSNFEPRSLDCTGTIWHMTWVNDTVDTWSLTSHVRCEPTAHWHGKTTYFSNINNLGKFFVFALCMVGRCVPTFSPLSQFINFEILALEVSKSRPVPKSRLGPSVKNSKWPRDEWMMIGTRSSSFAIALTDVQKTSSWRADFFLCC